MLVNLTNHNIKEVAEAVLETIPHGAENAITSRELEKALLITHDELRHALRYLRAHGAVICSGVQSPGYYKPRTPNEAEAYVRDERHRIEALCRGLRAAELYVDGVSYFDLLTGGRGVKS